MSPNESESTDLDVLIVGTGFSGTYLLYHLRKVGFRVKAIDAAPHLGGVWCNNTYPGARVDIEVPIYELDIEEIWNHPDGGWTWSERFPGGQELQEYFHFIDKRLGLTSDCVFGARIESAIWIEEERRWAIRADDGRTWKATYFLPCVGYASKPYIPPFEGLHSFEGPWTHTSRWPRKGIKHQGKRVGIIGTGKMSIRARKKRKQRVGMLIVSQVQAGFKSSKQLHQV